MDTPSFSQKKIAVLITIIVVIFGGGYYAFSYWQNYNRMANAGAPVKFSRTLTPSAPIGLRGLASSAQLDLGGTMYFSLTPLDESSPSGIYSYSLDKQELQSILVGDKTKDYFFNMSPAVSPDGSIMAFARKPDDKSDSKAVYQIFTSDLSGKDIRQITRDRESTKREPVFSRDGKYLAYVVKNKIPQNTYPQRPDSWSVYITDLKGDTHFISRGLRPIFSPDGKKLLMLRNDGLHLFNIEDLKKPKDIGLVAKPIGNLASKMMRISVSPDGNTLAWAHSKKDKVSVYRITSWDNFSLYPLLDISTNALWVVFSPDGKYLAVNEIRKDIGGKEYPVVFAYDLKSGDSKKVVNLNGYDYHYLWLESWIY